MGVFSSLAVVVRGISVYDAHVHQGSALIGWSVGRGRGLS
jgi:hypothetical protein